MCHYVRQRIRSDWDLETIVKDYFAIETELAHRQFEREREITMEALRAEAGRGLPPTHRLRSSCRGFVAPPREPCRGGEVGP